MSRLEAHLDSYTAEGVLYERLDRDRVRCVACAHRCVVLPGGRGVCRVRYNQGGTLRAPWGYVSALHVDPIEKKPFYHVLPGTGALTFGMLGCNLHCEFCQNWDISQVLRDDEANGSLVPTSPEGIVDAALRSDARSVVSSYNEPLITAEWAHDVFRLARARGLRTAVVSNGYASAETLEYLRPVLDCFKIDLKATSDAAYRRLGARLDPVVETIRRAVGLGLWVEVVTLVVPGLNDSPQDLRVAADLLASISPDLPWHLTAFHPDYRVLDRARTSTATLLAGLSIGRQAGLRHVYVGNVAGPVGAGEDTVCPACGEVVVERSGFRTRARVGSDGKCPGCGAPVAGVWA